MIEVDSEADTQTIIYDAVTVRDEQGSQDTYGVDFGDGGIELDPDNTYAFVLEYTGDTKVDLRGFTLADQQGNTLFSLNEYPTGGDDVQMSGSQSDPATYDGVIYVVEGDGSSFTVTDVIGYDIAEDGTLVLLDSTKGEPAFDLDLSLLTADNPDVAGDQDMIEGTITGLDISGEQGEGNIVTLSPADVLDLTDAADGGDVTFTITGDTNDMVNLPTGEWAPSPISPEGYESYTGTVGDSTVTLLVETEVQVNMVP
ncbi:MAG TPA: hypothetical protein ENO16_04600 [Chromatiales bacterium]|nr:hypothetical protein [Chromatiales bacterium]